MIYILSICCSCGSPTKQVKDAFNKVYESEQRSNLLLRKSIDSTYRLIQAHRNHNPEAAQYADAIMLAIHETDHFIDSLTQDLHQLDVNSREVVSAGDVMRRRNTDYLVQEQMDRLQQLTRHYPALDPAARQQIDSCWYMVQSISPTGSFSDLTAIAAISFLNLYITQYSEAVLITLRQIDRQLQP